jgi:peptidoglycan/LPS O-acetylase OafA/YrhL
MRLANHILANIASPFLDLSPGNREALLVFAALLLIITLLVAWILYFRNPSRRRRSHRKHSQERSERPVANELSKSGAGETSSKRRRKVRRSSHPQRPINPTLAQTRGLPPLKGVQQDPNSSY